MFIIRCILAANVDSVFSGGGAFDSSQQADCKGVRRFGPSKKTVGVRKTLDFV
jgi:hypothetical protein